MYGIVKDQTAANVLWLEDKAEFVKTWISPFMSHGFNIINATKPDEALGIFDKESDNIDIVFLDLHIPDDNLDGSDVFVAIRKMNNEIPITAITGYSNEEKYGSICKLADDCITKPLPFPSEEQFREIMEKQKDLVRSYRQKRSTRERTETIEAEITGIMVDWLKHIRDPDKHCYFIGGKEMSPREFINEIVSGTPLGLEYKESAIKICFRFGLIKFGKAGKIVM